MRRLLEIAIEAVIWLAKICAFLLISYVVAWKIIGPRAPYISTYIGDEFAIASRQYLLMFLITFLGCAILWKLFLIHRDLKKVVPEEKRLGSVILEKIERLYLEQKKRNVETAPKPDEESFDQKEDS